ncbi:YdcF family protein [Gloeocapsa sp. PCC 73106]|uniref:YdcF family protein n=1 Tax=Gloeocapsa sp. PCC 73106 TaxID=102232 RepID=UPI0002ABFE00|nr:YdcF family protein [Gloeocapsa sp. PCC 73106]ELR97730.1 hypothetical protein GLO73106DRAFT_00015440 [Gloeocapsa sp. PCC 73106]
MDFLFLSKLLPLFFYPLGFASLLLVISLILGWKYPRWTPFPVALALLILLVFSNEWVSSALVQSLESRVPSLEEIPQVDAMVVLGGATKNAEKPRPMVDVNEHGDRLFYAAELYRQQKAPLIILAGGRINWGGNIGSEAADMAQLLQLLGVPPEAMILEPLSLNTYENAINVQEILKKEGIERILLVTSAFHMPRSLAIFEKLGIDAIAAPTDFFFTGTYQQNWQSFILNLLPDAHRLSLSTMALKEYFGIFIYRLKGWL